MRRTPSGRGGGEGVRRRVGARLASAAPSQLATPIAVLALAAVFVFAHTGGVAGVSKEAGTRGGPAIAGGAGATNGGASGAAAPTPGGASAPPAPGVAGGGSSGSQAAGTGSTPAVSGVGATSGGASSSGASGGTAAGGQNGPGVSATKVRIGFVYVSNTQAANDLFGVHIPDPGNGLSEQQALVAYVNAHGGIGGRQIDPVYVAENEQQVESDPTIGEETCHTMTEDYHVFAVIGGGGSPDSDNANSCYAQAGTLSFDTQSETPDLPFLRQAAPYIWFSDDASLDRTMRWEIAGLADRGFFSGGAAYKLGVVIAQDPVNERVWQDVTLPALKTAGVSNPDTFEVPHDTLSDTANTIKQAVIRFQVDGVTNVIFQGGGAYGGGSYAGLFMLNAESQHYNPRYGLSSDDGPVALTQNVSQDQFQGTLVVGVRPAYDTDDQHYAPWPSTPGEKQCASVEAAGGNTFSSREAAFIALGDCDAVFELQQGAQGLTGQPLNAQSWADQLMKLGSTLFDAGLYQRYAGADHWDAAGGYRLLHAVLNCEGSNACFVYDNPNLYH